MPVFRGPVVLFFSEFLSGIKNSAFKKNNICLFSHGKGSPLIIGNFKPLSYLRRSVSLAEELRWVKYNAGYANQLNLPV